MASSAMSDEANPPVPEEKPAADDSTKEAAPDAAVDAPAGAPSARVLDPAPALPRPSFVFLALVSILSLGFDLGTKVWAKTRLERASCLSREPITVIKEHAAFLFACN